MKMISVKKIYPSLIIFTILSILLIAFIVWPLFKQIKEASQGFSSERNQIVYLSEEKENIGKIEKIYKTYESDLNKVGTLFFDPAVPINFINFLEKTATDTQVKMEISSMVKQAPEKDWWSSLVIQVVISGSFNNASKFLEKIESGPYLIEVASLNAVSLTKDQASAKNLEGIPSADTKTVLTIKVYTK